MGLGYLVSHDEIIHEIRRAHCVSSGLHVEQKINYIRSLCESPIEEIMGTHLLFLWNPIAPHPVISAAQDPSKFLLGHPTGTFAIRPQGAVLTYRLDFQLIGWNGKTWRTLAAVECDGRSFHALTDEQRLRDLQRDGTLEKQHGVRTFRFSGADIYESPAWLLRPLADYVRTRLPQGAA
jgi:hypothetical protein